MIITAIVTFLIAALSGLGVGGGGLFVIYLSLFTDTPQLMAQGINLLFFLFSSGSSLLVHFTKRHIFAGAVAVMAVSGIAGALLGTFLSGVVSPGILRKIFGGMLVVTGILSLQSKKPSTVPSEKK